jgi:hypothetical protein
VHVKGELCAGSIRFLPFGLGALPGHAEKGVALQHIPLKSNHDPLHVMAGLVPAIHVFTAAQGREDVDARDKRGHDGGGYDSIRTKPALVIGNSAYRSVPAPPNTQNDASDIAESFGRLGFSVKKTKDATFDETRRAWLPSSSRAWLRSSSSAATGRTS